MNEWLNEAQDGESGAHDSGRDHVPQRRKEQRKPLQRLRHREPPHPPGRLRGLGPRARRARSQRSLRIGEHLAYVHSFACCGSYLFALTLSVLRGETVENRRDLAEMMREPLNE